MIAATKIAVLLLVAIIALAMSAQGRELLDYYDDCYNQFRFWDWGRGDFYCHGYRWDRGGRWYGNGDWHDGRGGF